MALRANTRELMAQLLDFISSNAEDMFDTLSDNIESNIFGGDGFYRQDKINESTIKYKNIIAEKQIRSGAVTSVQDVDYGADEIFTNLSKYQKTSDYTDKIEKHRVFGAPVGASGNLPTPPDDGDNPLGSMKGVARYQLFDKPEDIKEYLFVEPQDVDYKLNDDVLSNPVISEIVRAALTMERTEYGHQPWIKFRERLSDQSFMDELLKAPPGTVRKVENGNT